MCDSVALKLKDQHPELGTKTCMIQSPHDITSPWIMYLCKGGLCKPNAAFLRDFRNFDKYNFDCNFHGSDIDREENVIERFYNVLKEFNRDSWPDDAIRLFAKVRTFIRIKALNKIIHCEAASAKYRSLKQYGQYLT